MSEFPPPRTEQKKRALHVFQPHGSRFFFPRSGGPRWALVGLATWSPGPRVPWPPGVPWSVVPWSPLLVLGIKLLKRLQCARPCFACALLNGAVQASRSGYVWGGGGGGRGRQSCTVVIVVVGSSSSCSGSRQQ